MLLLAEVVELMVFPIIIIMPVVMVDLVAVVMPFQVKTDWDLTVLTELVVELVAVPPILTRAPQTVVMVETDVLWLGILHDINEKN